MRDQNAQPLRQNTATRAPLGVATRTGPRQGPLNAARPATPCAADPAGPGPGARPRGRRRGAQGFTLMEVIAVVIIMAILAAVMVPRYMELVGKATDSVAQSVASEGMTRFKNAYTQYLLDTGKKPSSLTDLTPAAYLNLDGGGRVNVGGYDLGYATSGSVLTVSAYAANTTSPLATATMPWP